MISAGKMFLSVTQIQIPHTQIHIQNFFLIKIKSKDKQQPVGNFITQRRHSSVFQNIQHSYNSIF